MCSVIFNVALKYLKKLLEAKELACMLNISRKEENPSNAV